VLTTAALDALHADELGAVLAHERAHAAGRHDLLLDAVRVLESAFPRVALFSHARRQLVRLVEMRADDVALQSHSRLSLARALVTMATGNANAAPVGALAATGGDAAQRLDRLLAPRTNLTVGERVALGTGIAAVALLPVAVVLTAWLAPGLGACLTLFG
jgi:Zn-dependent protease with chaperone function